MNTSERQQLEQRSERAGYLAFTATVIAAYLSAFLSDPSLFTRLAGAVLLALGIVFTWLGNFGIVYFESSPRLSIRLAYFAIQIALVLLIVYLSQGFYLAGFVMLPLAAQAAGAFTQKRWVVAICATMGLLVMSIYGWLHGPSAMLQAGLGYFAGTVFVVAFTQIAVREQRARLEIERLATELRAANQKLGEYAAQAEELATSKERNRLAREIHDSVGHYLTVANVQLEAARVVFAQDRARALDALEKAQRLVREGLGEVRHAVAALRATPTQNQPLPAAIQSLIEESRAAGIQTTLQITGDTRPLSPQAELTLYRAAQEGLTNTRKHAQATHAALLLDYADPTRVRLVVQDDGQGADSATDDLTGDGFGLVGVRERAQILGGMVRIYSTSGQGFKLEVELPTGDGSSV